MAAKKTSQPPAKSQWSVARVKEFAGEVKVEFNKIAWPDRKHTLASTGVVVVFVALISFYLGAVDLVLGKIISFFLR